MSRFSVAFAAALGACVSTVAFAQGNADKVVWPDEGPRTWAPRPTTSEITANDLRTRLYQFADDSMQGRKIGEPGNYKGTAYIAREFQRLGLRPAGEGGTYFQNLPYGTIGFDSTSLKLVADGATAAVAGDWIPVAPSAANGFGANGSVANLQTVFAGQWGDTSVALDPSLVRGKIAVFSATAANAGLGAGRGGARGGGGSIPSCSEVPDRFGADAAARYEAETRAADANAQRRGGGRALSAADHRAQQAGAAGILLVVPLGDVPRTAIAGVLATRVGMQPAATNGPSAAAISPALASRLFGRSTDQLSVGATGKAVSMQWRYAFRISATPARNVIAILPGSDPARANEYVLVGAHNDHVGVNARAVDHDSLRAVNYVTRRQGANDPECRPTPDQQHEIDSIIARARSIRPPRRDSIMNGADDDGSGTVILLEIAERFATEHPARSIIFVSHEGEEAGLLGSRWFTDHPTIPLSSVVAAHNMDMEAKGKVWEVKFGGPNSIQTLGSRRLSREFGDVIDSVNAISATPMAVDKSWDVSANPMNRFCRSDQVNYVHHDIPVTYFSTGYALDYHQLTDEPQYADYDHMARVGHFVHDIMLAVADRKTKPAISGADPSYPRCG